MKTSVILISLLVGSVGSISAQIRVQSTITTYTDSSTVAILSDSLYLQNLSGRYLINNAGPEVATVNVTASKTLQISLPGQGEHDLIPIIPILFAVKNLQKVKILFFIDRFGQSRAIDIIDEKEGVGSMKRQIGATKQGTFKNE